MEAYTNNGKGPKVIYLRLSIDTISMIFTSSYLYQNQQIYRWDTYLEEVEEKAYT